MELNTILMEAPTCIARIIAYLRNQHLTLGTAESCSGGLIAHMLTNVSGVSDVYEGGVVTYSNALKSKLLGVSETTLIREGAVSAAVAQEMAAGALEGLGVDWALAVTGIAGPSGGTPEKPVGLVYMAVAGPDTLIVRRHVFNGNRESIKLQTAEAALTLLWESFK